MRLWHKDLISVLPRKQLLAQWRECCAITKNIATKSTPNHVLVNKVLNYSAIHFICYVDSVLSEMSNRGYKISKSAYVNFTKNMNNAKSYFCGSENSITKNGVFPNWHNDRYLRQCYYNLQEKYDCGAITHEEWLNIERKISV